MKRLDKTPLQASIEVDGVSIPAKPGEPVSCAMLAAGESVFSRSIKYHRPRGPFCGEAACAHCLMQIDGNPNMFACRTPVRSGMRIERQNSFPTAKLDIFAATDFLFPKGLNHHEMFAGVPIVEKVMAKVARKLAGLGRLPKEVGAPAPPFESESADVVIIGGGLSGLACAEALETSSKNYVIVEREAYLGGRYFHGPEVINKAHLPFFPRAGRQRTETTALGIYLDEAHPFLLATTAQGALKRFDADVFVCALGANPSLPPFENNDLPGVYSAQAISRMIRINHFLPGRQIVVAGDADEARAMAAIIQSAGGEALAVGSTPIHAHGVQKLDAMTVIHNSKEVKVDCDAVALCGFNSPRFELARQGGADIKFEENLGHFIVTNKNGATNQPNIFVCGQVSGAHEIPHSIASGRNAAASLLEVIS